MASQTREIILCPKCNGSGCHRYDDLADYHKGLYNTKYYECEFCETTGRVIRVVTTEYEKIKPVVMDKRTVVR